MVYLWSVQIELRGDARIRVYATPRWRGIETEFLFTSTKFFSRFFFGDCSPSKYTTLCWGWWYCFISGKTDAFVRLMSPNSYFDKSFLSGKTDFFIFSRFSKIDTLFTYSRLIFYSFKGLELRLFTVLLAFCLCGSESNDSPELESTKWNRSEFPRFPNLFYSLYIYS